MAFPIAARFAHPDNGYKGDQDQAAEHLKVGKVYTLTGIDVGRSSSRLFLDIPDGPAFGFNTVMFDPASVFDQDDEDAGPKPAPELAAAMAVIAEYERLADGLVIPNRTARDEIRRRAGLTSLPEWRQRRNGRRAANQQERPAIKSQESKS